MFKTLERQYLNKLVKSKVGDFASPEAFHALKVQRLGDNVVKPTSQVSGAFEVPISALVGNLAIKACEFTDSTPPIVRAFLLSADCLIEFSELVQGVFQRLRMLNLLTGRECQIGVHPEVYPYAFTCSGHHFFGGIICHDVEPQCSDSISADLDILDVPFPLTVLMERKPTFMVFVELLGSRVPHFERDSDTTFFKFIGIQELRRTIFATLLELWFTNTSTLLPLFDPIKELFPSKVQADNYSVKRITGDPRPVFMGAFKQLRQVRLKAIPACVFPIDTVIPILKSKEVVMHITEVIKHITDAHVLPVFAYLIFVRSALLFAFSFFHWSLKSQVFNPYRVGRQTRYQGGNARYVCQLDATIIAFLGNLCQVFFQKKNALALHTRADFPPQPKGWGLQSVF